MWSLRQEASADVHVRRFEVLFRGQPATFTDVMRGWRVDRDFRSFFNDSLAAVSSSAFRWETPPVTTRTALRPFEFVLLNNPSLDRRPDPDAFAEHFRDGTDDDVVAFPNLGGDAIMVVPRLISSVSHYGHLAAFVRGAPEPQRDRLWQVVGESMARRLSDSPVWLSTAGAGVSWLHVRLDDRPKYYGFAAYRSTA